MDSEELRFMTEDVEMAVMQFYRETSERLNSYLTLAQTSRDAWTFCWELLRADKPSEVQYYGANSLHYKISKHWGEIPEECIASLRDGLLRLLETHSTNQRAIVIRICVCIGCYILQAVPHYWPNALNDIMSSALQPADRSAECRNIHQRNMLEILTVIPEEFTTIYLPPLKRSLVRNELKKASGSVLRLVYQLLAESWTQEAVKVHAVKCLSSWLQLGAAVTEEDHAPLVYLLFDILRSPMFFSETAEALTHLFKIHTNQNYPKTMMKYLKKVTELESFFDAELHDVDVTQSLTKIFVSAAENNIGLLLSSIAQDDEDSLTSLKLLSLIVKTVAIKGQYPTEELCSDLSFGFWYNFQDEVTQRGQLDRVTEMMRGMFLDMFNVMTRKSKYPAEHEYNQWSEEDKEVFRCYRQDFADAAAYFSGFVGTPSMVRLFDLMTDQFRKLRSNVSVDWQEFESIIHMMTSVMEGSNLNDTAPLYDIYAALPLVPCSHNTLVTQIMFFIASCAEVMEVNMFTNSVMFILKGLAQRDISSAASMSLKDLLFANRKHIPLVSEDVLEGLKLALECDNLESSDYVRLTNCLGLVLPVVMPEQAIKVVEVILTPHVNVLFDLSSAPQLGAQGREIVAHKLKMLTGLFSSFPVHDGDDDDDFKGQPRSNTFIYDLTNQLLPLVKQIINFYILDEGVMNELFEMLKRTLRALSDDVHLLVPNISEVIVTAYTRNPLPCILEVAKSMFTAAAQNHHHLEVLSTLLDTICGRTLQIVEHDPHSHPDIIETFMNVLNQVWKRSPLLSRMGDDRLLGLFGAALIGIGMNECTTSKSSSLFMSSLILNSDLTKIIQAHGRKLLEVLVLAIAVNIPRHNLNPLADIFVALLTKHFDFVVKTLNEVMTVENFPLPRATATEKQQFVKAIISSQKSKRKVKETINEYAMVWRGILNSEYGAQTISIN